MQTIPPTHLENPLVLSPLRELVQNQLRQSEKSRSSMLGRFQYYWQGNPKTRIAVGLGLLASGMVATATGAMGVAGVMLGVRAGISAIGAFTTTRGLCEIISSHQKNTSEMAQLLKKSERARNIEELEMLISQIESSLEENKMMIALHDAQKQTQREQNIHRIIAGTAAAVV